MIDASKTNIKKTRAAKHVLCRELTTLWVARLDEGTELKVTDPKEQQGDVEEKETEGEERRDRVDWGRRRAGCCWRGGSFERLQCGG